MVCCIDQKKMLVNTMRNNKYGTSGGIIDVMVLFPRFKSAIAASMANYADIFLFFLQSMNSALGRFLNLGNGRISL